MFRDWRHCDQSLVNMNLDQSRFYYLQAQAWHLKGYLGGTHSYCTFHHNGEWLVVELSDRETIDVQEGDIIYIGTNSYTNRAPCISKRAYNAKWFGHTPYIVDSCLKPEYNNILNVCESYPFSDFNVITQNCNTFTSYLIYKLQLQLKRPIRSVGYRSASWWRKIKND